MRNSLDFSSWQAVLSTLLGLVIVSLVAVGIRLLAMHSVQQRRERQNRQINERLKTLIAAYKVLGGSFTGNLAVDPSHRRDQRFRADGDPIGDAGGLVTGDAAPEPEAPGAERRRRIRDSVEAALSDVILLGTETQVRLAAHAASEMAAGRAVETAELVVSLRAFIREVLDLEPIPAGLAVPRQGPVRASAASGKREGGAGGKGKSGGGGAGSGGGEAGLGGLDSRRLDVLDAPERERG